MHFGFVDLASVVKRAHEGGKVFSEEFREAWARGYIVGREKMARLHAMPSLFTPFSCHHVSTETGSIWIGVGRR
jgi:hypothetical protein